MKYYEMHDEVYKSLEKKGKLTWDGVSKKEKILKHQITYFLEKKLSKFFPQIENKYALDLGTGTGVCAFFLEKEGFIVDGLDISPTAIRMAKKNAFSFNSHVNFQVKDVAELSEVTKKYEFITDSSCLHCLVKDSDRENLFTFIKESLNNDGLFFIHTMIQSPDMSEILSQPHFELIDDILWSVGPEKWKIDSKLINGRNLFPHRKILTCKNLTKELTHNGFEILDQEIIKTHKNPYSFIGWLRNPKKY